MFTADVTGVGANSIDRVLRITSGIQALVDTGKTPVADTRLLCGGQTATVLCACAAMELRTRYVGAFGRDEAGQLVRGELTGRGVDASAAVVRDAPNAGAVIVVDRAGLRTVLWDRDERLLLAPGEIPESLLRASRLVHVDDVDPAAALHAARIARERAIPITSDLEQVNDATDALVSTVTYPIFDHNAPASLTGERDPERALRKLRRLNGGLLCMTLGDQGAAALDGDRFLLAPAVKVDVVDSTGAGDVFRAGFIYGLLQRWPAGELLRFANQAAAISCTRLGAIASVPSLAELRRFLPQRSSGSGL